MPNGTSAPPTPRSRYLDELNQRVLVYDGAMGTSIQDYNLPDADFKGKIGCNEYLTLVKPAIIEEIHQSFLEAGCDVLETDTFGGSRLKLQEYGLGDQTYDINYAAAQLARRLADRYSTPKRPRFIAGSIGPTGMLPSSDDPVLGQITFGELANMFAEQARALVEGGCDLLLIETSQDVLEVRAAIVGISRYFRESGRRVPLQAQVTLDTTGRMLLGTDVGSALVTLEALSVDAIGLNCSTGPEYMREPVRYLVDHSRLPIAVIPNAGIPQNVGGRARYPLDPEGMARSLEEFVVDLGVSTVGGCCGTTPQHIKLVVEAVGGRAPRPRPHDLKPQISGAIRAISLHQEPKPLIVGERVNSVGSRRIKRYLLGDDYDGVLAVARQQVDGGAHALDVCVAMTERTDEAEMMRRTVKKLATGVEAPLVIDSTEADVIQVALETYPGRAVVNSINMENGRSRVDAVLPLIKEHGAAVIALTIDEEGMAKTATRKTAVARRIHRIATEEYGLAPDALIFDTLTFPLVTGDPEFASSALETIEGIRQIKAELPGVLTILGVSNVSFGGPAAGRPVLNSVFLYHAVQAGLDLAIVNPAEITPYAEIPTEERRLCDDLIFNRRLDALAAFIEYFGERTTDHRSAMETDDPEKGMSVEQRIHRRILHRKKDGIEALLDEALKVHSAVEVINDVLLPAMKDVGDKFGAGELILPFVLQSAEVMKRAVAHLEQFLEKKEGYSKGKVVLATVFGDVHDIGKNLVATILSNNGYVVHDLGKQVPINRIIDKALEVEADAIGLSALLVSTSRQMPLCVQELARRGLSFPVIIGGAAINRRFGYRALFLEDGQSYAPGVFYARDAFEGLDVMEQLTDPARRDHLIDRIRQAAESGLQTPSAALEPAIQAGQVPARSKVSTEVPVPRPPFWGWRTIEKIPHDDVFACLDLKTLFRLHWGAKRLSGETWDELLRSDFLPRLERLKREAKEKSYLEPKVIYGYYPCQSRGDELLVYDPAELGARREIARFAFPRQPAWGRLCLADYFASVDSDKLDVVAFQVVTVGDVAAERCDELYRAGEYTESYFFHGLSVQTAEALAEYTHRHIRRELGIGVEQGKRYSWGYPACPELVDHTTLFRFLPASELIGVTLTEAYQLVPEQSTAALVVHHPEAIYYSTTKPAVASAAPAESEPAIG